MASPLYGATSLMYKLVNVIQYSVGYCYYHNGPFIWDNLSFLETLQQGQSFNFSFLVPGQAFEH